MKFVKLPKGTFYMGWDGVKKGKKTEIKEDFEIAIYTVTQGQWQTLMGNNPSCFSRERRRQGQGQGHLRCGPEALSGRAGIVGRGAEVHREAKRK